MDISVLLALDTTAFEQGLKAAADALGAFNAGAGAAHAALGATQTQLGAVGAAAKAQADAQKEAAAATASAAEASDKAADSARSLNAALRDAKGGLGIVNGTAAMASGSLSGMAGGAVQAANGMRMLGVSLNAAMDATLVLALVASLVALFKSIASAREEAERFQDSIRLDNLAAGVKSMAENFRLLADEMQRASALARGLDEAGDSARRIEQQKQLAQLEKERAQALLSGGDADAVNRSFDARKRALEFSFRRDESADAVGDLQRARAENAARREQLQRRAAQLQSQSERYGEESQAAFAKAQAGFWQRLGRGDFTNSSNAEYRAEGENLGAKAEEIGREWIEVLEQIKALEGEDRVLAAKIESEQGRSALLDLQEEAERLGAAAAALPPKEEAAGQGRVSATGLFASPPAAGDRLARIGGYVGGGAAADSAARENLRLARERNRSLQEIARNTERKDTAGAVLA
ncbi:MAG: hypothetical protein IJ783_11350 [Kiritimatiellae bacterium]|nr:hypothetical protein [Kiritimatiellia bacterium]